MDPLENLDTQFSAREIINAAAQVAIFEKLPKEAALDFGRGITRILAWALHMKDERKKEKKLKKKK